nr:pyridoxal-phosphate dependent enzyme [Bradyrhizobium sp. 186]
MRCVRCHRIWPFEEHDYVEGCPACLNSGWPASVKVDYQSWPNSLTARSIQDWLVYTSSPLLGEGCTPLVEFPVFAEALGVSKFFVKNEAANPTGSHKDRMAAMLVQRATELGVETVAAASSGNAGAALAAYAGHAGLSCVVVTTQDMSPNWRRAVEMHGATLLCTSTSDERWNLLAAKSRSGEWYPATNYLMPPVGSNPIGVDGYRAIAFELFVQMQANPATDVLVPTSRGDLIWGIAQGFADLRDAGLLERLPRVHAVEPFPRIRKCLENGDYRSIHEGQSAMVSIGGSTVTYQSIKALRISAGTALAVTDREALDDQGILARNGLYLELSSAATLSAARSLTVADDEAHSKVIVCLGTSHGYKEYENSQWPTEVYS